METVAQPNVQAMPISSATSAATASQIERRNSASPRNTAVSDTISARRLSRSVVLSSSASSAGRPDRPTVNSAVERLGGGGDVGPDAGDHADQAVQARQLVLLEHLHQQQVVGGVVRVGDVGVPLLPRAARPPGRPGRARGRRRGPGGSGGRSRLTHDWASRSRNWASWAFTWSAGASLKAERTRWIGVGPSRPSWKPGRSPHSLARGTSSVARLLGPAADLVGIVVEQQPLAAELGDGHVRPRRSSRPPGRPPAWRRSRRRSPSSPCRAAGGRGRGPGRRRTRPGSRGTPW